MVASERSNASDVADLSPLRLPAFDGANNVPKGGANTDTLRGGLGTDSLYGKAGNDTFQFLATADSAVGATRDIIYDLDDSGNDTIDLSQWPG